MDVEGPHRRPDGEELAAPARALKQGGLEGGHRSTHDTEPAPGHRQEAPYPPGLLED